MVANLVVHEKMCCVWYGMKHAYSEVIIRGQWTVTADTFTGHYQLKLEDKFGFRFTNSHYDTPEDDYAHNVRGWTRSRDRLAQSANNDDDGGGLTPAKN